MYELNEEELKQVVGGFAGFHSFGAGVGAAGATWGQTAEYSNAGSYTTPSAAYASGNNFGYARGYQPSLLSGATAQTSYVSL